MGLRDQCACIMLRIHTREDLSQLSSMGVFMVMPISEGDRNIPALSKEVEALKRGLSSKVVMKFGIQFRVYLG